MPSDSLEPLLCRVAGEYLEMPGLQLTRDQAQRLWALDHATCTSVLDILIQRGFLIRGADNRYRRASDSLTATASPSPPRDDLHPRNRARRAG